jgi:hypothetical protein
MKNEFDMKWAIVKKDLDMRFMSILVSPRMVGYEQVVSENDEHE